MAAERRTMMLGGGLVLAVAFAAWTLWGPAQSPAQAPSPTRPRGRQPQTQGPAAPVATVAVRLDELKAGRDEPGDTPRNPFRFQPKVVPAPPQPVAPPQPPMNLTPQPEAPRGTPPPPAIPLKFIGILEKENGVKFAVLSEGRGPIYGREGQTVEGRYKILKIGAESIELAYEDGRGKQTIRLTGQ